MHSVEKLLPYLQQNGAKPVDVTVLRSGQQLTFHLTPQLAPTDGKQLYRIGFVPVPVMHIEKLPFVAAVAKSANFCKKNSLLVIDIVGKMLQHKASIKQMTSPIGLGVAAGQVAKQGTVPLIAFTAFISLQLGLFNLFPIPILDGGMILLLAIEGLMRRDISLHVKERIFQAAFVMLILFAVVVMYNDIAKMVPGLGRP
jgi:regulator of sigma E protease